MGAATTASRGTRPTKCYVGTVSLGHDRQGRRRRRTVRGKTKTEVRDKLKALHEEINAGVHTPATYTIRECVSDWLDALTFDPHTMATYRGQAEKWIYPTIGSVKLKDFKVADAERFFREIAAVLSKRSLMMVKSTLRRSIRRAQKHDLIGKNVAELIDLPEGQPGRPSRAMTEEQASKVLAAATGHRERLRQGGQDRQGQDRRHARGNRGWPGRVRQQAAQEYRTSRCKRRPRGRDVPSMPRAARHRRRREPAARGAFRPVHHARPPAWRATRAHLGPRGPGPGRDPRLAFYPCTGT